MKVASELIFVGGNRSVEPSGASKRHGYELTASLRPMPGLSADAAWAVAMPCRPHTRRARQRRRIGCRCDLRPMDHATAGAPRRGARLVEHNSIRARSTTLLNLRAAWTPSAFARERRVLWRDAERTELAQIGRRVLVCITPVRRAAGRCGMGSQSHRRAPHVTHGSALAVLGQRSIHLVHQTSVLSLGALTIMARGPTFINTKSPSLGPAASRAAKQSNRARH